MNARVLRLSCRLYAVMLRAYPASFRREYSREMMLVFENRARDVVEHGGGWALLPFLLHIIGDWITTVAHERNDTAPTPVKFGLHLWDLRRALPVAAIPTIAFALHDLVFQMRRLVTISGSRFARRPMCVRSSRRLQGLCGARVAGTRRCDSGVCG